jgi:hypothetical protein
MPNRSSCRPLSQAAVMLTATSAQTETINAIRIGRSHGR